MKIISKYKDYYDYYQGVFGMDNTKIYNRNDMFVFNSATIENNIGKIQEEIFTFAICGIEYSIRWFRGNFYYTPDELKELDEILKSLNNHKWGGGIEIIGWVQHTDKNKYENEFNKRNGIKTDINRLKREPILVNVNGNKGRGVEWKIPLLSSFNFHTIMDNKTIYIEIETFLGWLVDNPPLPDTQTNLGKIEGHGFDKITSFRPNMK